MLVSLLCFLYHAAKRIKLKIMTEQSRAYGRDCLGYVFVPKTDDDDKYIGTFESSGDGDSIDPDRLVVLLYDLGSSVY